MMLYWVDMLAASLSAVVLGGLEGARQRLTSQVVEQRITALTEVQNYGAAGLALLM